MTELYPREYQYAQIPAGYHPFMAIPAAILLISFQLNRLILLPHMKDNIPTTVTSVTASGLVFERRVIKDGSLFLFNQ
jgi:hypothetical protein